MIKIGITGLIGSGKSVIASIFGITGIPVYNSDKNANILMNSNQDIIHSLTERFGKETYIDSQLNKGFLANIIFSNEESRIFVNSIVHPKVIQDFLKWSQNQNSQFVAIESALLFEANIQNVLDYTIRVISDLDVSAKRISKRDNITCFEAGKKINTQLSNHSQNNITDFSIYNNETESIILQCLEIIEKIKTND